VLLLELPHFSLIYGVFTPKELMMTTEQATNTAVINRLVEAGILTVECAGRFNMQDLIDPLPIEGYIAFYGLNRDQAVLLKAAAATRELWTTPKTDDPRPVLDNPIKVFGLLSLELALVEEEKFAFLLIDKENRLISYKVSSVDSLDENLVDTGEVFRSAIQSFASGIILANNHASGQTDPSNEEIDLLLKMISLGRSLQIPVLDYIIIGGNGAGYRSLRRTTALWFK
jgi:DNA repair protein RadC